MSDMFVYSSVPGRRAVTQIVHAKGFEAPVLIRSCPWFVHQIRISCKDVDGTCRCHLLHVCETLLQESHLQVDIGSGGPVSKFREGAPDVGSTNGDVMGAQDRTEEWSLVDTMFRPRPFVGHIRNDTVREEWFVVVRDPEYFSVLLDPSMRATNGVVLAQIVPGFSGHLLQTDDVQLVQSSQQTVDDGMMVVPIILYIVTVHAEGNNRDSLLSCPVIPWTMDRAPPFDPI